jgi:hypothetical protein
MMQSFEMRSFLMQIPDWLKEVEDGLWGNEDTLIESFKEGRELDAWHRQGAQNALDEEKIRLWLHSDEYNTRLAS